MRIKEEGVSRDRRVLVALDRRGVLHRRMCGCPATSLLCGRNCALFCASLAQHSACTRRGKGECVGGQAYYLAAPFAVERAPTVALRGLKRRRGVHISALAQYPVRGLVFEAGDALADLAAVVGGACARLTAANVPHNLFVVDCGQRLFLFPNGFAQAKAQGRVPEDLVATQARPGSSRGRIQGSSWLTAHTCCAGGGLRAARAPVSVCCCQWRCI